MKFTWSFDPPAYDRCVIALRAQLIIASALFEILYAHTLHTYLTDNVIRMSYALRFIVQLKLKYVTPAVRYLIILNADLTET